MTKTILVTDLKEINHVKVSCVKCGFAAILPLNIDHIITVGCAKCGSQFPTDKINKRTWGQTLIIIIKLDNLNLEFGVTH